MAAYQGGQRSAAKSPRKPKAPKRPPVSSSDPRSNLPGGRSKPKPKPKPKMDRPGLRYEKLADTRAPRSAYGLTAAPTAPKPKPPTRTTPSRPAARPSTPARPTTSSRRPAPKPPAVSSAPKVAGTSGIGPVKSGAAYASQKGSVSESVRQLREMRAASTRRQTGQAASALSSSKDYSSQFKDMKGGSSRFAAELKKKKRG